MCGRRAKAILAVAENAKNYILPLLQTKDETERRRKREKGKHINRERERVRGREGESSRERIRNIVLADWESPSEARCRR